jgi:hypothetical protein
MASRALATLRPDEKQGERRYYARSFGNPSAQLFWNDDDTLCCGLRGDRAELLRNLRQQGLFDSLVKQRYLAPFDTISGVQSDYSLVFRLARTPRISYCHEWSTAMWKDASLHLLKLLMALAEDGLTLRYPHPWHLLFDGPNPTYIHPGSIVHLDVATFRGAFERISQFFLRPLALASQRQTPLARQLLRDANRGVDLSVGDLQSAHNLQTEELHRMTPTKFLSRRIQEVQDFLMPEGESKWAEYQRELPFKASDEWHQKEYSVHAVLREKQPRRVLDLACNLGWYARLAALEGADVVAADVDELCVNRMYSTCREEGSRVLPLVINITDPAPGSGVASAWFPPATERLKSDLVLALAIMHHLVFGSHRLVMSEIVRAFASFTDRALLLEFVPLQSQGCVYSGAQRPDAIGWFTLDNCVASLGRVFRKVEVLPAAQHSRRLLLCEK